MVTGSTPFKFRSVFIVWFFFSVAKYFHIHDISFNVEFSLFGDRFALFVTTLSSLVVVTCLHHVPLKHQQCCLSPTVRPLEHCTHPSQSPLWQCAHLSQSPLRQCPCSLLPFVPAGRFLLVNSIYFCKMSRERHGKIARISLAASV